jgi:hypothetical protein
MRIRPRCFVVMPYGRKPVPHADADRPLEVDFDAVYDAVRHMTYFTFGIVDAEGSARIRSATCFFLKTPSRVLVVTARHVVDKYLSVKECDPRTLCQIGNIPFDPEERLIAKGEKADIYARCHGQRVRIAREIPD